MYIPGLYTTDTEALFLDLSIANGFFLLKFMINVMTDFNVVNFLFWMVTFPIVLLIVYTFRNSLGLRESAIMLRTSTREINVYQSNFSSKVIGIINFEKKNSKFYCRHYE